MAQPGGRRGPWPVWQNRDLVPIPGIQDESLSEDSSTEGSSSSSSSSRRRNQTAKKRVRKWRLKFAVTKRLKKELLPPRQHQLHGARRKRRNFLVVPKLLDAEEIRLIHDLWHHPSVEEIKDRKKTLQYRHIAYRMELPLRAHGQHLYAKLIDTMAWADAFLWQKLPRNEFAYPEVEYIVYEGKEGLPGSIEPHVDNHSAVTIVVLLSDPSEFKGGVNCFASPDSEDLPARVVSLDVGDAVLFRGEKLRHWITPVTEGRRVILQIELSRV
ncbi:unnamed protein product [Durusdinium trenchii]|uniref:Fe2OG dioxygenase domain-containing protein n=1 Tax=Durusdinium trenchii TaxID=1381693 RepID=A0ABP0H8Z0_9DINO